MKTGVDKILQQMGGSPEKNKTGVDKILEILENGGGGGGGGLPEYTSADNGKVLTLGDGETSSADIVPEQALVISGSPYTDATSVDNANTEYFVNGATIHVLIIDRNVTDVDEDVTVTQFETGDIYGKSNTYQFYIEGGVLKFWCNYAGTYTVHVTVSSPSVEPKWETAGGYVAPASSTTVTNTIQSLISDVMTSIITGSKTNMVCKSAILTHSDLASDYAILRETAEKYCSGVHTLFPVATDAYSTVVNGYSESGGTGANLQLVVPNYGIQIPGVGRKLVFLVIAIASSGNAYQVYVSAQIKEDIT